MPDISDEEEAEIHRPIANNPDAAEATDEQLAQAKTFSEACPELHASIMRERAKREGKGR